MFEAFLNLGQMMLIYENNVIMQKHLEIRYVRFSKMCTVSCVPYAVNRMLCTICCVPYAVCRMLCTAYAVYRMLCTVLLGGPSSDPPITRQKYAQFYQKQRKNSISRHL